MTEFFGYSRQQIQEENDSIELIPDFIREEVRVKVATIFGNAELDSTMITDVRNGKAFESVILYRVVIPTLTAQMIEMLDRKEFYGLFISRVRQINNGRDMELDIKIHDIYAKLICSRDGANSHNGRVQHVKDVYNRDYIY